MTPPKNIQLIGTELALLWEDGSETYIPSAVLRAASPSAETAGERDILGVLHGGDRGKKDYSKVEVQSWQFIGNYAIRFRFSDKHSTGLYSYELLKSLGES